MKIRFKFFLLLLLFVIQQVSVQAHNYIWTGIINTDWNNGLNWSNGAFLGVPGAGDDVTIQPVLGSQPGNYPVIKSTESYQCINISFNTLAAGLLTVNGTLTASGTITLNHYTGTGNPQVTITGTGTLNCAAIAVGDAVVPTATNVKNVTTLKVNITTLNVAGAITVNSATATAKTNNAAFNIADDNGATTVIASSINTTNTNPASVTISGVATLSSSVITLTNSSTGAIRLKLTGATPVSIASSTYGSIDFNVPGGTGSSTVEYAGASAQAVATSAITGIDTTPGIYQHLSFSAAGAKTLGSGTLSLTGNWNSAGGTIAATSPTVIFQGANQVLTDAGSNSGAGVIFKNITFSGSGTKTISGSTASLFAISSTGVLTMAAGALTVGTNGKLTLQSDASGTASVATIPSGSSITGNVNVQRYFKAGTVATNTRNYRLLSSPVNTTGTVNNTSAVAAYTLGYLNNNPGVFIAGPGGPTNGFTVTNATPTMYVYKEGLPASNTTFNSGNFKGIANISGATTTTVYDDAGTTANVNATLYAGNGYMLYYAGNNTANVTSTTLPNKQFRVGGNYIDPDAATVTAVGTLNQGNVPVKIWATGSTTLSDAQTGFNLVGNPYASTIDWDTFSNSSSSAAIYGPNVKNTIYVFNYTNKNYGTYQTGTGGTGTNNASRYIAGGQGFFVTATSTSAAALTFTESAKTTVQPSSLGASYLLMGLPVQAAQEPQILRLKLAKDSINTDESMILFEANSQNSYEKDNDATRINGIGNIATLATYAAGSTQQLAINHLHSIDSTTRVKLYVSISASASNNSLSITGFNSLDIRYDAYLLDHYKNDSVKISATGLYNFTTRTDSTDSFGANRFELVFHKKANLNYSMITFTGKASKTDIELKWTTKNEQNLTGFVVQKSDNTGGFKNMYTLQSDGSGAYTWTDKTPRFGPNNYRLKQSDAFDNVTYTPLSVYFDPTATSPEQVVMAYPNPVTTQFSIKINTPNVPEEITLKVVSTTGRVLISKVTAGTDIQQNISNLMPGAYIVEVSDNATKKLIGRVKISKP
jgi:hypothetical protein